jgi:CheY-like chemotaxis protein
METKKVLIVDDDVVIPTTLIKMLPDVYDSCEYRFRVVKTGAEGVQAIEEYEPDLVFTDLSMVGGNGTLVIRKANAKKIPVVLMATNQPGDELYQEAVAAEPTYILGKPFEKPDLETAVEKAFSPDTDLEGDL